jgi:hypothetical protein
MNKLQDAINLLNRCYDTLSLQASNIPEEVNLMDDISMFIEDNDSEEVITDTQRLDWLCLTDYNIQKLELFSSMYAVDNNTVRVFIDNQINNE